MIRKAQMQKTDDLQGSAMLLYVLRRIVESRYLLQGCDAHRLPANLITARCPPRLRHLQATGYSNVFLRPFRSCQTAVACESSRTKSAGPHQASHLLHRIPVSLPLTSTPCQQRFGPFQARLRPISHVPNGYVIVL